MVVREPTWLLEEDEAHSVVRSFALLPCGYNTAKNGCRIQLSDLANLRFLNIVFVLFFCYEQRMLTRLDDKSMNSVI